MAPVVDADDFRHSFLIRNIEADKLETNSCTSVEVSIEIVNFIDITTNLRIFKRK